MTTTRTKRHRVTCTSCGRRGQSTKPDSYVCQWCRRYAAADEAEPFQGRRVRVGLVWKFVPDEPEDLTDVLARTLAETGSWTKGGLVCADCGCLLGNRRARCPGCLWWVVQDAVRSSWDAAVVPYGTV